MVLSRVCTNMISSCNNGDCNRDNVRQNPLFYKFLLLCTVAFLGCFLYICHKTMIELKAILKQASVDEISQESVKKKINEMNLFVLVCGNLLAVMFSRGLHVQFSLWIFFTLPFLLQSIFLNTTNESQQQQTQVFPNNHIQEDKLLKSSNWSDDHQHIKRGALVEQKFHLDHEHSESNFVLLFKYALIFLIYFLLDWTMSSARCILRLPSVWNIFRSLRNGQLDDAIKVCCSGRVH